MSARMELLMKVLRPVVVPVFVFNNALHRKGSKSRKAGRHIVWRCAGTLHAVPVAGGLAARARIAGVAIGHTTARIFGILERILEDT